MSQYTDILNEILAGNKVGDDLPRLKQLFAILDERTPPKPEDGFVLVEPWISEDRAGSLNWIQAGNGGDYIGSRRINLQGPNAGDLRTCRLETKTFVPSDGTMQLTFSFSGSAPTVGDETLYYAGVGDSAATSGSPLTINLNGVAIVYDPIGLNGNYHLASIVNGTAFLTDTGIAFNGDERFFRLTIKSDSISYETKALKGDPWTTLHVETTNIPSSEMGPWFGYYKLAGTANKSLALRPVTIRLDYA